MRNLFHVQDKLETERKRRIKVAIAAYAYEFDDTSIMSDAEFDNLCLKIDPEFETGNSVLDYFFRTEFSPHTGQWIHKHPELHLIRDIYLKWYKNPCQPTHLVRWN